MAARKQAERLRKAIMVIVNLDSPNKHSGKTSAKTESNKMVGTFQQRKPRKPIEKIVRDNKEEDENSSVQTPKSKSVKPSTAKKSQKPKVKTPLKDSTNDEGIKKHLKAKKEGSEGILQGSVDVTFPDGSTDSFQWTKEAKSASPGQEAMGALRAVADTFDDKELNKILKNATVDSFENLKLTSTLFNHRVEALIKSEKSSGQAVQLPTEEQVTYALAKTYAAVVDNPSSLNKYKGFSPEVYGETEVGIMRDIARTTPILPTHNFIDLGSGIGQVVLQMAGEIGCKHSFGIELMNNPAEYQKGMGPEFKKQLARFKRAPAPFELVHGDFLKDPVPIASADVIFVNNVAFGPELNHMLALKFAEEMQDGARVVSYRPFVQASRRRRIRRGDPTNVIVIEGTHTFKGKGVSWTDNHMDYYIHKIDRSSAK